MREKLHGECGIYSRQNAALIVFSVMNCEPERTVVIVVIIIMRNRLFAAHESASAV